eukprot:gene13372-biopygen13767
MAGVSWRNVALNEADPAASPGSMRLSFIVCNRRVSAVAIYIPPPQVADIPQLQAAGMLIVDQAATSGYTSPIHWDILPQGYWREVKEAATQNWKSVGEFVKTLLIVAAAQVPLPGPVVDPAALALQQQLAKQQQDHLLRWRLSDSRLTRKRLFTQRHWRRFGADPLFDIHPAKVLMPVHLCPELVAEDPDTLVGNRTTLELLQARVFTLKQKLSEWWHFVHLVDPSFVATNFDALGDSRARQLGVSSPSTAIPQGVAPVGGASSGAPHTRAKPETFRQRGADIEAAIRG